MAALHQRADVALINVQPLRLAIGAVGPAHVGTFVIVEPEPAQRRANSLLRLVGIACLVGILDAQHEGAAVTARVGVVKQGSISRAHVRVAGGARRDAYAWPPH